MLSVADYLDIATSVLKVKSLRRFNFAPRPRIIAYTVTWRCNAACDMCGVKNVDRSLKNKEKELNAHDISRIFSDPFLKNLDLIRFTGGEPFLKEDFADIVEEIIKNTRTKIYYITTNGFYTHRIHDLVKRLAPETANLTVQISLDAIGKPHDDIRKVPGLYDRVIKTLEGLKELKSNYRFNFGINQTVTSQTAPFIEEISALSRKFGCGHKLYLAHEAHESDILEGENLEKEPALLSKPKKDEIKALYERIERHRKKQRQRNKLFSVDNLWTVIEKSVLLGSKNRILESRAFPNPDCLAMFFYLRFLPDGRVMPCTMKPKAIGNLKEKTFTKIWKSKAAACMRSEVRKCPGCWVECDIVPNIAYSLDVIGEMCKELYKLKLSKGSPK